MDASQVTIMKETIEKNKLTRKRRFALREEAVKALIQRRAFGKPISSRDFMYVTSIKSSGQMHQFLKRLEDKGVIQREVITPRRISYTVPEKVKVTRSPKRESMNPPSDAIVRSFTHLPSALDELVSSGMKFTLTVSNGKE